MTNEYPYIDNLEVLEFTTETWIGQDMRKGDVLNLATRHIDGDQRIVQRQLS